MNSTTTRPISPADVMRWGRLTILEVHAEPCLVCGKESRRGMLVTLLEARDITGPLHRNHRITVHAGCTPS